MKNQYRGGDCLKKGAWTVCKFKRGFGKKDRVVFLREGGGGLIPQCTLWYNAYVTQHYTFKNLDKIAYYKTKHNFFKNSFFSLAVIEWNK